MIIHIKKHREEIINLKVTTVKGGIALRAFLLAENEIPQNKHAKMRPTFAFNGILLLDTEILFIGYYNLNPGKKTKLEFFQAVCEYLITMITFKDESFLHLSGY